jgi:hypothetical protein
MNSPKPRVAMLALTLAETCVKNCGFGFHAAIANADGGGAQGGGRGGGQGGFLGDLAKLAKGGTHGPRSEVQRQALALVQQWGIAFAAADTRGALPAFADTYDRLRGEGVQFAASEGDAPVFTPPPTAAPAPAMAPAPAPAPAHPSPAAGDFDFGVGGGGGGGGAGTAHAAALFAGGSNAAEEAALATEFVKLKADLATVDEKVGLCRALMGGDHGGFRAGGGPGGDTEGADGALLELASFLEACKPRLAALANAGMEGRLDEESLATTLRVNDDVCGLMEAFDRGTAPPAPAPGGGGGGGGGGGRGAAAPAADLLGLDFGGGGAGGTGGGGGGSNGAGGGGGGAAAGMEDEFADLALRQPRAAGAAPASLGRQGRSAQSAAAGAAAGGSSGLIVPNMNQAAVAGIAAAVAAPAPAPTPASQPVAAPSVAQQMQARYGNAAPMQGGGRQGRSAQTAQPPQAAAAAMPQPPAVVMPAPMVRAAGEGGLGALDPFAGATAPAGGGSSSADAGGAQASRALPSDAVASAGGMAVPAQQGRQGRAAQAALQPQPQQPQQQQQQQQQQQPTPAPMSLMPVAAPPVDPAITNPFDDSANDDPFAMPDFTQPPPSTAAAPPPAPPATSAAAPVNLSADAATDFFDVRVALPCPHACTPACTPVCSPACLLPLRACAASPY